MISCDTNILFDACEVSSPYHQKARQFLMDHAESDSFCMAEQVLLELYCLLRNPTVCRKPCAAAEAAAIIARLRDNPRWLIVDVMHDPDMMNEVWKRAAEPRFAYRRIFDVRLALTLRQHRVTEFATRNTKDFTGLGFSRVWNPLS